MTTAAASPATVSDPSRLALIAQEMGIDLARIPHARGVDHLVTDPTTRTAFYVTALSCDCPRFVARGACPHHAFLLAQLGRLPA